MSANPHRFSVLTRILCTVLAAVGVIFSLPLCAVAQSRSVPSVSAQSAILIEAESGTVVYSHQADTPLPMASTTKIATAITALSLADPKTQITVDESAVGTEGSSIYLTAGEVLTLEQLLYALLLESANDAAVAIAVGISGSVEAFAEQMNRMAASVGSEQTHFTNPHGLDDAEHFTTAYELAMLTRHAMQNELFCTIVATRKTTVPHMGEDGVRLLVNHNKLLRLYEGCIGVKTGFTKRSGRCLVSAAERDGVRLIAVTLNAPNDWDDHTAMLNYGFTRFRSVTLCRAEECCFSMPVTGGSSQSVLICNTEEITKTLPLDSSPIKIVIEAQRFAYAPVAAGEPLGAAVFYCDTDGDGAVERLAQVPLYACRAVERDAPKRGLWSKIKDIFT